MSEILDEELVDTGENTLIGTGFTIISTDTVSWDGSLSTSGTYSYMENITRQEDLVEGETYRLMLSVSNYSGTGDVGFDSGSYAGGISGNAKLSADGVYTEDFVANGTLPDIFGTDTSSATIHMSIKKILVGNVFGFLRLEANNIQKIGVVIGLINNTIAIDPVNSTTPSVGDYIFFVKNQVVNMSGLRGYYADVKLENDAKNKVELFSLNSEITESSK